MPLQAAFLVRMLYACLVTSRPSDFANGLRENSSGAVNIHNLEALSERLDHHLYDLLVKHASYDPGPSMGSGGGYSGMRDRGAAWAGPLPVPAGY